MELTKNFFYQYILFIFLLFALGILRERISTILKLYDIPNSKRKIHKVPISLINGFIILITLNLYFIFDILFFKEFNLKFDIIMIILVNFFYLLGYYDDIKDLSPKTKSFLIFGTLLITIPFDQNLILNSLIFKELIDKTIYLNQSSIFITIFFIYIFYNFMNFIDGLNGVAISVSIFFIIILTLERGQFFKLEILMLSCLLYCLILNLANKSFLGNSGISALSILISIFYIRDYNLYKNLLCDEIFLIFFIPGLDMTRLVFSRILSGKSISDADKNHLHHYLTNFFDKKYVFIIYIAISIIPYIILILISKIFISIITSLVFYIILILFLKRTSKEL